MKPKKPRRKLLIPFVLAAGIGTSAFIASSEEEVPPARAVLGPAFVETLLVTPETTRAKIPAWGFVQAREAITLRNEVRGRVISVGEGLVAGRAVEEGEFLFQIDPTPYEIALAQSRASVQQAVQQLEIEKGQQEIARAEIALLQQEFPNAATDQSRALRVPQLREKEALIQLEQARRQEAELDITRTEMRAPCSGQLLEENVAEGVYLEVGEKSVQIACLESQRVFATFSADASLDPSVEQVSVTYGDQTFDASILSVLPQIDPSTRQRVAVIEWSGVDLPIGAYVSVALLGQVHPRATRLPATAIRADHTVWVLSGDGRLEVRPIQVLAHDGDETLVGSGLEAGDEVILSHIANPLSGLRLQASAPLLASKASP